MRNQISIGAQVLRKGGLVAFPTETVYGLGADANNDDAVRKIFKTKGRPTNHPLIVHISSSDQLSIWARNIPEYAKNLADKFWPGPLTLILKNSGFASDYVTGGNESIGVRVPSHPLALELLDNFQKIGGFGIAAPSANRFGAVSSTSATAVKKEIGKYLDENDFIVEGGECEIGIESTIINCLNEAPSIIRPGFLSEKILSDGLGVDFASKSFNNQISASGEFKSHYSPRAFVALNEKALPGDGFIAFSSVKTPNGAIRLASPDTLEQFAKFLYKALSEGDEKGLSKIVVITPEGQELAEAICDRLFKAAAFKQPKI
jgi:L-threonylcarbamoyladenylate synthase